MNMSGEYGDITINDRGKIIFSDKEKIYMSDKEIDEFINRSRDFDLDEYVDENMNVDKEKIIELMCNFGLYDYEITALYKSCIYRVTNKIRKVHFLKKDNALETNDFEQDIYILFHEMLQEHLFLERETGFFKKFYGKVCNLLSEKVKKDTVPKNVVKKEIIIDTFSGDSTQTYDDLSKHKKKICEKLKEKLTDRQMEILLIKTKITDDLTNKEIADKFGIHENTVINEWNTARKTMSKDKELRETFNSKVY